MKRYAGILAGGIGSRMGNTTMPKQFLKLGTKSIIMHTIDQFLCSSNIDVIIVAIPNQWKSHMESLIEKEYANVKNLVVISGGNTRNETIVNVCNYINNTYETSVNDILVTHDAVRPFVTQRIIEDNVNALTSGEAEVVDTVVSAIDTIVESTDGSFISNIPNRDIMYQGQTPQSFKINSFLDLYLSLNDQEKEILSDAAKVFVMKGKKVKLVMGEHYNMKITTAFDLSLANALLKTEGLNNYDC